MPGYIRCVLRAYREVAVAAVVTAAAILVFVAVDPATWPGVGSGCIEAGDCYCESFHADGFAVQPVNTASNLGFVLVGLGILTAAGARRRHGGQPGPVDIAYGASAVGLGLGSALFHGTMTWWGGWADLVSMYLFIGLVLSVDVARAAGRDERWALRLWAALVTVLALVQLPLDQGLGKWIFAVLIAVTLLAESRLAGQVSRDRRWLWAGLGLFLAGFAVWSLSRTGGAICQPDSAWQGHALWHLTSAGAVALIYRYLRSEQLVRADFVTL